MDKLIDKINTGKFLVAIHEYLCSINNASGKGATNDDLGTRIAKTLINEVVKLKRNDIWTYYEQVKRHSKPDTHLEKWI